TEPEKFDLTTGPRSPDRELAGPFRQPTTSITSISAPRAWPPRGSRTLAATPSTPSSRDPNSASCKGPEAGRAADLHHRYPCARAQNRAHFSTAAGCIFGYESNLYVDYAMKLRYKLRQPRSLRACSRDDPECGARRGVLRRRLVTAGPGRPGKSPARHHDLAARSSLYPIRRECG